MGPQNGVSYREMSATEVLPELATSKTFSRVFWYSVIESKVCQKVGVGRRKSLKHIRGYHAYMIIWKPLFGKCL